MGIQSETVVGQKREREAVWRRAARRTTDWLPSVASNLRNEDDGQSW